MATIKELKEQRGQLVADARKIKDKADAEKRDMTADEAGKFDELMDKADEKAEEIRSIQKKEERDSRLAKAQEDLEKPDERRTAPPNPGEERRNPNGEVEFRYNSRATGEERIIRMSGPTASEEYRQAFRSYLLTGRAALENPEVRDALAGSFVEGGALVAPQQFVAQMIKFVDDQVYLRQLATVIPVPAAQSLGAPSFDTDMGDPEWTAELQSGSDDDEMRFGGRELFPQPLARRVKVSNTLLRIAALNVETLVRERLGYKVAVVQEKAYMTGSGAAQPLGVFTASSKGISTARDVSEDNTSTAITADGLVNAKYALKAQYQMDPTLRWIFHRDGVKRIRKLKDSDGRYIWQEGLSRDKPDTILDVPYIQSEFAPNTFTTGQYVGIIGVFRNYWIADALGLVIQRLVELYAQSNQIGFHARYEGDGMPVLEEAFARVKLG